MGSVDGKNQVCGYSFQDVRVRAGNRATNINAFIDKASPPVRVNLSVKDIHHTYKAVMVEETVSQVKKDMCQ